MEDGSPMWGLGILLIVVLFSGVLYAYYTALYNLTESALDKLTKAKKKRIEKLQCAIEEPHKNTDSVLCIVTLLNIICGICVFPTWKQWGTWLFADVLLIESNSIVKLLASVFACLCILCIIMMFGILLPKYLVMVNPEKHVYRVYSIVRILGIILAPAIFFSRTIAGVVLKLMGIDINKVNDNVTEEEIVSMVNEGHEQGIFLESEAEMINNIIEFGDKNAEDIMTHRKSVIAVDSKWTLRETVDFILRANYSRFPVYRDDIDTIIGVLHLKDALRMFENTDSKDKCLEDIKDVFLETLFVPEKRSLNDLFKEMRLKKIHIAIVVDEYGQTAGIVAMEDVIEEIVGNILDEYDEEDMMISNQDDGTYIINGMAELDEIGEILGIEFEDEEFDTLNGLLVSKLERIPREDERPSVEAYGCKFDVLEIKKKIIQLVRVTKLVREDIEDDLGDNDKNE